LWANLGLMKLTRSSRAAKTSGNPSNNFSLKKLVVVLEIWSAIKFGSFPPIFDDLGIKRSLFIDRSPCTIRTTHHENDCKVAPSLVNIIVLRSSNSWERLEATLIKQRSVDMEIESKINDLNLKNYFTWFNLSIWE